MKYVVEVIYSNRNEWSDEFDYYGEALNYALAMSELQGVGETKVWYGEEVIDTVVDGIIQGECEDWDREHEDWGDEDEEDWDEPYDPFDEVGYDPYGGCFNMDL